MEKERNIYDEHNEYVFNMDKTKSLLLDLFLSKELTEAQFKSMMDALQEWYKEFFKKLWRKPINENQVKIDFND